ncbi:thioredoxin domain-containing protein [Maridesulfovibrio ferrireducens]|uniref:DsbA family protein n=1 Tax=Maridesulfovibrio ferrireducens TaxID=246191 RepID=UPI001A1AC854|nr:thioredoxin domain-containing protein [Maridesulfovibrio ferrireducens]MBI9111335.1 thioredoxin domain-containing protein [Maridesulfovibrio ferrireducens]
MLKNTALFIVLVMFASGCVSKQGLKEQIAQVIKDNPQIVLDAMRENNIELLTIVESGIDSRSELNRREKFQAEIDNPLNPVISPDRASIGNPEALVTIVEYSDFLCPYCSKGAKVARDLVASNPNKYRLIYKHLPLHEESKKLAAVYEAIALLDKEKAFKFHDVAFEMQKSLYNDSNGKILGKILLDLDIDLNELEKVLKSKKIVENLAGDKAEAKSFGFDATPTFLVNGVSIRGYVPADKFESIIGFILEKSPKKEADDGEVCEDCLNKM